MHKHISFIFRPYRMCRHEFLWMASIKGSGCCCRCAVKHLFLFCFLSLEELDFAFRSLSFFLSFFFDTSDTRPRRFQNVWILQREELQSGKWWESVALFSPLKPPLSWMWIKFASIISDFAREASLRWGMGSCLSFAPCVGLISPLCVRLVFLAPFYGPLQQKPNQNQKKNNPPILPFQFDFNTNFVIKNEDSSHAATAPPC